MSELFPPSFVEGIRRLRVLARDVPHARDAGEHAPRHSGAGIAFRDFRPYAPGDDLRRVDWNAYRRSRRLMTRLYHEPRRLYAHILLDVSESMFFEDPPRADAGRRVAAALAAAAADHHDQVAVYPFGAELAAPIRLGNAGGLANLLAGLERLGPAGATDARAALRALLGMRARPGLLVLISDFFDPAGTEAIFDELDRLRHRVVLVRLTRSVD